MTDMTTPGAGEGERWEKQHLGPDEDNPFRNHFLFWAVKDSYSRLAVCFAEKDADLIVKLHNAREADQQTIAKLEGEVSMWKMLHEMAVIEHEACHDEGAHYKREEWQQTIAELRKALEVAEKLAVDALGQAYEEGSFGGVTLDTLKKLVKALAAIAATEEGA